MTAGKAADRPAGAGDAAGRVVIVTGPPGAGKTTVARLLAERLSPSVHLRADDFWHVIRNGWIAPYLPRAHAQNETVIGVVAAAAVGYARGGYQVVCDGIVGPWFLDVFRMAAAGPLSVELHYVVLRPDPATTLSRAVGRGENPATGWALGPVLADPVRADPLLADPLRADPVLADPESVRSLHRQFSGLGDLERHVLDPTRLNPRTTAGTVLRGLRRGSFLLPVR